MYALMESPNGEQMNVPEAKIEAFEKDGWKVMQKISDTQAPEAVQTPEGEKLPAEVVEKAVRRKKV